MDPGTLPNNYGSALATLKNTERTLSKDERWADTYLKQMEYMVERGVAGKLSRKELQEWNGPTWQWSTHGHTLHPCESYLIPVKCAKECLLIPV